MSIGEEEYMGRSQVAPKGRKRTAEREHREREREVHMRFGVSNFIHTTSLYLELVLTFHVFRLSTQQFHLWGSLS